MMRMPENEELDFGRSVADLLSSRGAIAATRRHADDPSLWNAELWQELLQMGVGDLVADGELGAALAFAEALGAQPATVPALSTAVILPALLGALGAVKARDGVVAVGPFGTGGALVPSELTMAEGTLRGSLPLALCATWADELVAVVPDRAESVLVAIDLRADGVTVSARKSMDTSLPFADVTLEGVPFRELARRSTGTMRKAIGRAERLVTLWICAGELGTAQHLLDMAVTYAAQRVQFGMPIAERQAIKHKCADMLTQLESARSALWDAAGYDIDDEGTDATLSLSVLRIASDRAVDFVAQQSFQIHGGIGFTWEHDLQLLFKRAIASRMLFSAGTHRENIATILRERR